MLLRLAAALALALLALLPAAPARAQANLYATYSSDPFVNSNLRLFFDKRWQIARLRAQGKHAVADAMEGRATPSHDEAGQPLAGAERLDAPLALTSFTPAGAPRIPARVAESAGGADAARRTELEAAFSALLQSYEDNLDAQGEGRLHHNLAGAFNFLFAVAWYVAGDGAELSEAQQEDMLGQVNLALALGLRERPLDDREKQDAYEAAALAGMLALGLYNEGRDLGRPGQVAEAQALARDLLDGMMGIGLDRVRLEGDRVHID